MKKLVVRHGTTDANRLTRAAFGKKGAELNAVGLQQARTLSKQFSEIGVDVKCETVAVSELQRTYQTALEAGFQSKNIRVYSVLNEVNTSNPANTQLLIAKGELPPEAIAAAKAILANPPKELVWVTHGLVIAALEHLLGQTKPDSFIPNFCEIREIIL